MSFNVDVAGVGASIGTNCLFGGPPGPIPIEVTWPGQITEGKWFAAALHINSGSLPGASVQIQNQATAIHADGSQGLELSLLNVSQTDCAAAGAFDPVSFTINILAAAGQQ